MKVALAYDEALTPQPRRAMPADAGAEYEDAAAIKGLLDAIAACGHQAVRLPFSEDFARHAAELAPELVFNIAEGLRGPMRESIVPAWLDHLGIGYTGSDGLTLAVALDKALTKQIVSDLGVRTPRFFRARTASDLSQCTLAGPLFVKPNAEGSSMGIGPGSRVDSRAELERQVRWTLDTYRQDCLIEEFAPGREFCVGILGNDELRTLPVVEVEVAGGVYTYTNKSRHDKHLICPADIPDELATKLQQSGLTVYRALRCRDFARIDFRLDATGEPAFIEINPLPGLASAYSIFPAQARAAGISYEDLIGSIINYASDRLGAVKEQASG
jgi:D-alanine-D-alanine ligase